MQDRAAVDSDDRASSPQRLQATPHPADDATVSPHGGRDGESYACELPSPTSNPIACGTEAAIAGPACSMLAGLPGKLIMSVRPRMPATALESIQWRLW